MTLRVLLVYFSLFSLLNIGDSVGVEERLNELESKVKILTAEYEKCQETEMTRRQVSLTSCSNPQPVVAFSAAITSNINPVAVNEIIIYDHVHINQGNAYDPNVGGFKATVKGIYHFAATMMSYSIDNMEIEMVYTTSGSSPKVLCRARASQTYRAMGVCIANVRLNVGDDVWVRHYSNNGNYVYGSYYPTFSGHLIYAEE